MKNWRILEVHNEIFRRRRNECIEQASDSYDADQTDDVFVRECGDPDCSEKISLRRAVGRMSQETNSAMRSGLGNHAASRWRKRTGGLLGGTADGSEAAWQKEHPRALLPASGLLPSARRGKCGETLALLAMPEPQGWAAAGACEERCRGGVRDARAGCPSGRRTQKECVHGSRA